MLVDCCGCRLWLLKYLSNIIAHNQDYQNLLKVVADLEKENKRLYLDIARLKKSGDAEKKNQSG